MVSTLTRLFPLWAALAALTAWLAPAPFAAGGGLIAPLLGVVMFAMGATLTPADFARAARMPGAVAAGVGAQYLLMPLFSWLTARALGLPPELAAGLIVVGCCPGGVASNVICYLARGDVALSVTLTFIATALAVVMTPALTWFYAGAAVDTPVAAMMGSVAKIVVIPVALGVGANTVWGGALERAQPLLPLVSMAAIVIIIGIVVGLNHGSLGGAAPLAAVGVVLTNAFGLAGGYALTRALGFNRVIARTVAIEVGMQNSGLGVALAIQYFGAAAALPGALYSVWHNISGSLLAGWLAGRPVEDAPR